MYYRIVNEETKEVAPVVGEKCIKLFHAIEIEAEQAPNGHWYEKGHVPQDAIPTIEQQIKELEEQITDRNVRSAILGDEYAISKLNDIENQIKELRKQL